MPEGSPYLILATPAFGGQVTGPYLSSVLKLQLACRKRGLRFNVLVHHGDALVQRARQDLVARFLQQGDATHLLFVDADIGFDPEQVFRLLDFGVDMAAAVYPLKWMNPEGLKALAREGRDRPDAAALSYVYEPEEAGKQEIRDGFLRVRFAGTGFLMIRREALLSMMERYPELRYKGTFTAEDPLAGNPHRYALFNCMIDPKTGEFLSEDYSFCQRWREMGGEIWADQKSRLTHTGSVTVSGDFSTQFEGAPAPGQIQP